MDTIFLYNQNNDKFLVNVVRYFMMNNKKYLIFTLNELDENNYIQLYVARIENEYGKLTMKYIYDDQEWNAFKEEIQKIVMNNRNGIKNHVDIDYHELDGMVVTEFRIFKLKETVADELSSNKNVDTSLDSEPKTLEAASAQNNNLTIEEILKQVSETAQKAKDEDVSNNVSDDVPSPTIINNDEIDYESKYKSVLVTLKKLEDENIRLINELVQYKAKIETIKDIID